MIGPSQNPSWYKTILGITEVTGFIIVVLMGLWTGHYLGGFAWQGNLSLQFNWHPLLMTKGFIFLNFSIQTLPE